MKYFNIFAIALAIMTSVPVSGQTRHPAQRPVKRTTSTVRTTPKPVDKNALIRDSLIQENSELYKILYTKPLAETKIDDTGLTYKLMSVRKAKNKFYGGIGVNLIVENPLQDDSILLYCDQDPNWANIGIPIKDYKREIYCGDDLINPYRYFYMSKGVRYSFSLFFGTSQTPSVLNSIYIPEGSHTNSCIEYTNIEVDWEGNSIDEMYDSKNLSIDSLKRDNELFKQRLGGLAPQLTQTIDGLTFNVTKAIGEIKGSEAIINVSLSISNNGSYKKATFLDMCFEDNYKRPYLVLSVGKLIWYDGLASTASDEGDGIIKRIYEVGSNSSRSINLVFKTSAGNRSRMIQLLRVYEENSDSYLEFKNIPISWKK